jgi:hypothetical protein
MERREFLKLTLGLTAAAGAIAAAATTAQAVPLLADSDARVDATPKPAEAARKPEAPLPETAARDEADTDMSSRRYWRRRWRRHYWRPRRRAWRRRRVIYY